MSFLDKFKKNSKNDGGARTEQIKKDREAIKETFRTNLREIGFTSMEIDEVLDVITMYEEKIEFAKLKLIGTNINNPDPGEIMHDVFGEIREYELNMGRDIKAKIEEIKKRKQEWKGN